MDTELIRTFLEVNRTRHFARAAGRLFVTPAAVSARIRLLEEQLGTRLFTRSRNNIRLTAAGQRLLPHAEHIMRGWNRAMLSAGTSADYQEMVALGSLQSIWSVLLPGWLPDFCAGHDDVMLQVELLITQVLVSRVREQSLDLALLYEPPQVSDLSVSEAGAVTLLLVADRPHLGLSDSLPGYVHVDWGTPFSMTLARDLPDLPDPRLRVDSPELAHEFLMHRGGAAYLPRLSVTADLAAGRLHAVAGAPIIDRPVYLIQSANTAASGAVEAVRVSLMAWLDASRGRSALPPHAPSGPTG